jgi:hypothetical protein
MFLGIIKRHDERAVDFLCVCVCHAKRRAGHEEIKQPALTTPTAKTPPQVGATLLISRR